MPNPREEATRPAQMTISLLHWGRNAEEGSASEGLTEEIMRKEKQVAFGLPH